MDIFFYTIQIKDTTRQSTMHITPLESVPVFPLFGLVKYLLIILIHIYIYSYTKASYVTDPGAKDPILKLACLSSGPCLLVVFFLTPCSSARELA